MSSDDSHLRSHMMPTARNICTRAVFATSSFNFRLPTTLLLRNKLFFKESRAELFDCGLVNDMSKVTHIFVCIMSTPCFSFAWFSCFGSLGLDHLKTNFAWLHQRLVALSFKKTTVHINLLEYFF